MEGNYNLRNPAVKRLMREAQELKDPTEQFSAHPLDDNLFEWHFTIRGPEDTDFSDGFYHGRIILPPEYPMKPPSIILLTPSGRFETNKKICLSISGYHPETWLPSWSLRTALLGIIGFLPSHGGGAIGSLDYTPEERKALAKKSHAWKCPQCGLIKDLVLPVTKLSQELNQEAKQIAQQIKLTGEKNKSEGTKGASGEKEEGEESAVTAEATPTAETPAAAAAAAVVTTAATDTTAAIPTTTTHLATMTCQLPPYNIAHGYPFSFPPYHYIPPPSQRSQQQASVSFASVLPQQFVWPYPPNFIPPTQNQPFPFFNPPILAFPRMATTFQTSPFTSYPSAPNPLRVITTTTTTSATTVGSSITTTSTTPLNPSTTTTTTSPSNPITSFTGKSPKASSLLSSAASIQSSSSSPASSSSFSSSSHPPSDQTVSEPLIASTSSLPELSSSASSPAAVPASSSSPPSATELRHRFKPSPTTTTTAATTTSPTSDATTTTTTPPDATTTTAATTTNSTTTTTNSTPRIVRTHVSAEPSHRFNHHTSSGLFDAVVDLCVIVILFLIFGLLSRRVFMNI